MHLEFTGRLLLSALISIALCGCKRQPSPNVFVDPALATLTPPDALFVAGVRVQQLLPTPFYQRYIKQGKLPFVEKFARETGIDPSKELWEVLVAYDGKTSWVMMRGKFTEMGMEPRVNREGAQRLGYKGYTMLGDERMAVLFLNPTTAVAASVEGLRRIVDNRDKSTGMQGWLQEKITTIPSTNQAWFAGNLAETGMVTGGIDFRSGLNAQIAVAAKSDDDARRLIEEVRDRVDVRLYNSVQVRKDRSNLDIRVEIPLELLDELVRLIASLPESRHPDSSTRRLH